MMQFLKVVGAFAGIVLAIIAADLFSRIPGVALIATATFIIVFFVVLYKVGMKWVNR